MAFHLENSPYKIISSIWMWTNYTSSICLHEENEGVKKKMRESVK